MTLPIVPSSPVIRLVFVFASAATVLHVWSSSEGEGACSYVADLGGGVTATYTEHNISQLLAAYSSDERAELAKITSLLGLKPGMTLCDLGAGDGGYLAKLGPAVMPGGHLHSTGSMCPEVRAQRATTRAIDPSATAVIGLPMNAGLTPGSCDAMYSRMSFHMMVCRSP